MVSVASPKSSRRAVPLNWARTFVLAAPALCTLLILHLSLRGSDWRREWLRATDLVAFSWVMTGPIVAGAACVLGAELAKGAVFFRASERGAKAIVAEVASFVAVVVAVYAAAYAGVAVYVLSGPINELPTLRDLASALPVAAALASMVGVGVLVGWWTRSALWAPIVAVVMFGVIVLTYSAVPGALVQFGGATSTLIGLRPRLDQQLVQTWFYVSLLGVAVLAVIRTLGPPSRSRVAALVVATVSATASGVILLRADGNRFEPAAVAVECEGVSVTLCLADGYSDLRATLHPQLVAVMEAIPSAGLDLPATVTQDPSDTDSLQLPATGDLGPTEVVGMVIGHLMGPSCDVFATQQTYQAYVDVAYWLADALGVTQYDPSVSPELANVQSESATRLLQKQVAVLRSCA